MSDKVCILSTVHTARSIRIFYRQARTLVEAGYDVTLMAQHEHDEIVDGVKIIGLRTPRNRFRRMLGQTWFTFRSSYRQKACVYHFHDPELLVVGLLLKLLTKAKVVYDVHEDVPQQILTKAWIPRMLRQPLSGVFNGIEKLSARFFDSVVVVTESIASRFSSAGTTIVHNYPDLRMLPCSDGPEDSEGWSFLVYVGGVSGIRGAREMVQAMDFLDGAPMCRLEMIGRVEPPGLERELQALPGHRRVVLRGQLPWTTTWNRARRAIAGLVLFLPAPNHRSAMPNKLFEYMAAGLPVIASNFPLWKKIVEGNNSGLCVDPLNPKAIAEAAEYLITHPEEARKMGDNGRKAVEEKYNWETEAETLISLYRRLVG